MNLTENPGSVAKTITDTFPLPAVEIIVDRLTKWLREQREQMDARIEELEERSRGGANGTI